MWNFSPPPFINRTFLWCLLKINTKIPLDSPLVWCLIFGTPSIQLFWFLYTPSIHEIVKERHPFWPHTPVASDIWVPPGKQYKVQIITISWASLEMKTDFNSRILVKCLVNYIISQIVRWPGAKPCKTVLSFCLNWFYLLRYSGGPTNKFRGIVKKT